MQRLATSYTMQHPTTSTWQAYLKQELSRTIAFFKTWYDLACKTLLDNHAVNKACREKRSIVTRYILEQYYKDAFQTLVQLWTALTSMLQDAFHSLQKD